MSLGVLNNLSAMYAENNLNNTTNSLNTVLQQLSSGSKINSGADDAAGLSLVDGLQANSQALAQSQTNAQEGVGLLQVADGALSQVTSLLNRAVTLATEASNGTLNSSQDTAANQEYQSILSEINNIGTTTTYNDTSVFGQGTTNIYTGDSSTAGSSIDSLNISSLSSSNVGDTGGVMAYSNGQSSVFLNLSTSTQNAQSTDTLNSAGSSTINVNYLVKGADGASTPASTSITVGGAGEQPNTVNGLISAINNAGLGLTATFTTQSQAGVAGGGAETGIQISGGLISVGVDPNTASTGGTLNPSEITSGDLALGQVISVNSGSTNVATFTTTSSNDTLDQIATQINNGIGHTGGSSTAGMVTATVLYNSAGQETSLQLNDGSPAGGALTVTATPTTIAPSALTATSTVSAANSPVSVAFTSGAAGSAGQYAVATLAIPGGVASNNPAVTNLTGSIELSNGSNTTTFHLNDSSGNTNTATNVYITNANSSLTGLAAAIQASLGSTTTATASTSGITITSTQAGTAITTVGTPTLAATLNDGVTSNVPGIAATSGTDGSTSLSMVGDSNGFNVSGLDAVTTGTTLALTNGTGSTYTFTMGTVAAGAGTTTETTGGLTTGALLTAINSTTGTSGMSAQITGGKIVISSSQVNTSITAVSTLTGASSAFTQTGSGVAPVIANQSAVTLTAGIGAPATGQGSLTTAGTTLTGDFSVTNNGNTTDFIMSTGAGVALSAGVQTLSGANSNMAGLMAAINADAGLDLNATLDQTAGGAVSGLTLTATNGAAAAITTGGTGVTVASQLAFTTPTEGGSGQAQSALLSLANNGVLAQGGTVAEDGTLTGSISITTTTGGNTVTDTFNMGNSSTGTAGTATQNGTYNIASNKLSDLMAAINQAGSDNLDLTATQDAGTGGLFLQSKSLSDTNMGATSNSLSTALNYSASSASAVSYTPATVVETNGGVNSANDVLTSGTKLVLTNSATGAATTFLVGGSGTVANQVNVGTGGGTATLSQMASAIGSAGIDLSATATSAGLTITSTAPSGAGTITVGGSSDLTDADGTGTPTVIAGTGPSSATNGAVSINTSTVAGAGMSTAGTDALAGTLVLQNGSGTAVTFHLNSSTTPDTGTDVYLTTGANSTETGLMNAITAKTALGITASINASTGALQLQSNATGTAVTATSNLTDATSASPLSGGTAGNQNQFSTATVSLANSTGGVHNTLANTTNLLTGDVSISANGKTIDFIMGGTGASNVSNLTSGSGTVTLSAANSTVAGLKSAITNEGASLNLSVGVSNGTNGLTGDDLLLRSNLANNTAISATSNLKDTLGNAAATATLGTFASASDVVTGSVDISVGSVDDPILSSVAAGKDVYQLVNYINTGAYGSGTSLSTPADAYGVTASLSTGANGYQTIDLTSNTYGTSGNLTNGSGVGTSLTDHPNAATLTYSSNNAYNIGISNVANTGVYDSSIASESSPGGTSAAYASLTASRGTSAGIATISYSDGAGQSLSATDLSNQTDAQSALTDLNKAITDVAAQDGYIGAQINTLNAVSSVLSTQQENVVSAQNAVQATDYASATSNMSKYEILSQTGISALAQANSMQQEVTKLLQ